MGAGVRGNFLLLVALYQRKGICKTRFTFELAAFLSIKATYLRATRLQIVAWDKRGEADARPAKGLPPSSNYAPW